MANISSFLQRIKTAVYGEEVRGSIHDALSAMNKESSSAMEFAATAQDSARAFAQAAEGSAETASQKADESAASVQAAKTSEDRAKASEDEARTQASNAAVSAEAAEAAKDAAKAAEDAASEMAQFADDARDAAAQSEAEAKTAKDQAANILSDVVTLSAKTQKDREAAEAAKLSAESAADDANLAETNAKLSENAALTAQVAAGIFKDDAEAAKLAAQAAKIDVETAKAGAETAKVDAETARDEAKESEDNAAASALSAEQYSGKPPKPQDGVWWIWDAKQQKYINSGIKCELEGPTGNGIADILLTKGNHTPGTTDQYTVTMTDGSTVVISVYNGRNGTGAGDVLGIAFDLVLPASGWSNGEQVIADERFIALAVYKYLVGADAASREEYLECKVYPIDITENGSIKFKCDTDPTENLTVQVIRLELSANGT